MYKINVKVIKPGSCTIDPGNMVSQVEVSLKEQLGVGGGSTVTLIREKGEVLLVDTGYDREWDFSDANRETNEKALRALLEQNGVHPRDVTKVFITHFHRDHFGCIAAFSEAQWYCHRLALADFSSPLKERFIPLDERDELIPSTIVLHTPGHTRGHSSLLWTAEDTTVRVAICGDAILSLAWLRSGYTWRFNADFFDLAAAKNSAARLLGEADLLIPGHGQPFFARTARGR